jgi:hypothetical protein
VIWKPDRARSISPVSPLIAAGASAWLMVSDRRSNSFRCAPSTLSELPEIDWSAMLESALAAGEGQ